jgi:hypothetical protein
MPTVEPKLTKVELEAMYEVPTLPDGRKFYGPLPGITTDAEFVAKNTRANEDPKQKAYFGSKFFDPNGKQQNDNLKKDILAAFKKHKKRDLVGKEDVPHFVISWRHYPNAEHPRWQRDEPHACGCGCGCGCA